MMQRPTCTPPIQPGELIEYEGVVCEVARVSPCAAYIRRAGTRTVTKTDYRKGVTVTFEAHWTRVEPISLNASVVRVGWARWPWEEPDSDEVSDSTKDLVHSAIVADVEDGRVLGPSTLIVLE
jgi:hypothetical protein